MKNSPTVLQLYQTGGRSALTPVGRIDRRVFAHKAGLIEAAAPGYEHRRGSGIWLGPAASPKALYKLKKRLEDSGFEVIVVRPAPARKLSPVTERRDEIKMELLRLYGRRLVLREKLLKISRRSRKLERESAML